MGDETALFPKRFRLAVAVSLLLVYVLAAIQLCGVLQIRSIRERAWLVLLGSFSWLAYGVILNKLDSIFFR